MRIILLQCIILLLMFSMTWGQDSSYSNLSIDTSGRKITLDNNFYMKLGPISEVRATFKDSILKWYNDYQYELTHVYIQEMKWWIKSGRCGDAPVGVEPTFGGFIVYLRTKK